MKVKNLDEVMDQLRPQLKDYLESHGIEFTKNKFTCPNYPDHRNNDKKASAAFYEGGFKCFACEAKGDIFTAAHYLEGKPLNGKEFITDNVLYLAELFSIEYEVEDYTPDELKREELYKVIEKTCKLSHEGFKTNNEKVQAVQKYVKDRGWEDLVEDFEFGYCVYDKLIELLKKKGYSEEVLQDAGVLPAKGSEKQYEKYLFDDRLIFPIKNAYGRTVAVGSRLIRPPKNNDEEKYLQSRNTILYQKGNTLFNLDKARLYAKVYLVEGYADVFSLHKYGIPNSAALCGLSFKEEKYKLLVKNKIQRVVFCLDNDEAGRLALKRFIDKEIKGLEGLEIYIKEIPDPYKDVDEMLADGKLEEFKALPEKSIFEWKLEKFKENKTDEVLKADLISLIVKEKDYTNKEVLARDLAEVLGVSQESVNKEVARQDNNNNAKYLTTTEDILEEVNCFERVINDWDRKIWSRKGYLLGLDAKKFPIFVKCMDGVQNMFYLFAGDTNVGKSAFLLNMALDLIDSNEDVFVLFFSVDDSLSQLLPRMVSLDIDMPINTISNPKYKIKLNESLTQEMKEHMLIKRAEAIEKLKTYSDRFAIKEESEAKNLEDIQKYISIYKKLAGDKQLVVFVDNLHRISSVKKMDTRQLYMAVSDSLKLWKTEYDVPVIATAEIKKTYQQGRPTGDDIAETKSLQFDADVVGLLYNDFYLNNDTYLKFECEAKSSEGEEVDEGPIVEINISKNKTSSFKNKLYYKFYPEYSKYIECSPEETRTLRRKASGMDTDKE